MWSMSLCVYVIHLSNPPTPFLALSYVLPLLINTTYLRSVGDPLGLGEFAFNSVLRSTALQASSPGAPPPRFVWGHGSRWYRHVLPALLAGCVPLRAVRPRWCWCQGFSQGLVGNGCGKRRMKSGVNMLNAVRSPKGGSSGVGWEPVGLAGHPGLGQVRAWSRLECAGLQGYVMSAPVRNIA